MPEWIAIPKLTGEAARHARAGLAGYTEFRGGARHGYVQPLPPERRAVPAAAALLLSSAASRVCVWTAMPVTDDLICNADGDELVFIHRGAGEFFCAYGHLSIAEGDYLLVPGGTPWRLEPTRPVTALLLQAIGSTYALTEQSSAPPAAAVDVTTPAIDDCCGEHFAREWTALDPAGSENLRGAVRGQGSPVPMRLRMRQKDSER
ncbi:MAG: hypothetical protein AB7V27_17340 [Candidatus Binatia bacterium]